MEELVLEDDALAERMGRASREMALRDFQEERWRAEWIEAIDTFVRR